MKIEVKEKKDIIEIIARNIRKFRRLNNYTQEQLAEEVGVSCDFLRRLETTLGKEGISIYTLYKISIILNISIDKFFKE